MPWRRQTLQCLGYSNNPNRIPEWEQRLRRSRTRDEGNYSGFSLIPLPSLLAPAALTQAPAKPAFDERVDLAVEHRLRVPDLEPGAHVLDQCVRLEHVVPNLRSELRRHHLPADLVEVRRGLLLLALEQACLQHLHRHLAVFHLRPLVLAGDDDA